MQKLQIFFGGGDRKVREYLSDLPILKKDLLSIQSILKLAGLEMKENNRIEELTLGEKKLLFLLKLVVDTSEPYIFQNLFQDMQEMEIQSAARLIVEMSTYMNVILLSSSTEGYEICDRVIQWSENNEKGHIARSKIKDMLIIVKLPFTDVKTLLAGKKVPAVKSKESWNLTLDGLLELAKNRSIPEGKETEEGNSYEQYLQMMLVLKSKEELSMRALDLVEMNLRSGMEKTFFRADACVSGADFDMTCYLRRGIRYQYHILYQYQ